MATAIYTFWGEKRRNGLVLFLAAFAICIAFICYAKPVHAEEYAESELNYIGLPNEEYFLTDINGGTVSTKANGKPKILFFFNTTCPRCKAVEEKILTYGMNLDNVDFIMAESSNGGITQSQAENFFATLGINSTSQCYGAKDVCWEYLRACGYTDETTKKPIIIYITADDVIGGYTWNYTNIYKAAQSFGITLETGEHVWEDAESVDPETGFVSSYKKCSVCELKGTRTVEIPKPSKTQFVYNGKKQCVLANTSGYTVVGGCETNVGEYKAVVYLDDSENCVWSDGKTGHKVIKWSIKKGTQKPAITTNSRTMKKTALKKKAQSFQLKVSGAEGKKSFAKVGGSSRIKVNQATGKVTVKKKTAKGTYRLKVKVAVEETSNYEAGESTVQTITIRVK